jgi:hypothetical protein
MSESNLTQIQSQSTDKFCHRCKTVKLRTEFYKDKTRNDGLYSYCKICTKAHVRKWEIDNPEHRANNAKKWAENNIDKRRKIANDWVARNKEQHYKTCKNWAENNKGKVLFYAGKRRATKLKATPKFANLKEIEKIYEQAAQMRIAGLNVEVDHIVPLISKQVCGLHVEWNLQIIDATANRKKGNKLDF